jgi:hypothetical protein
LIRIADGDPINRVNLLYTIHVDRIIPDPVWGLS